MSKENYDSHTECSSIHCGNVQGNMKIVMLHGNGRFAKEFQKVADYFAPILPDAHIIIPNGSYKVPLERLPDEFREGLEGANASPFTWFDFSESKNPLAAFTQANKNRKRDSLDEIMDVLTEDPDNRVYLFGFSMGGIRAVGDFASASSPSIKGAVLHSSAITSLGEMQPKQKGENAPASLFTIMGREDKIMPAWIMKTLTAVHYYNQLKLRFNGISAKSKFIDGLGHDITEESATIAAKHIKARDQYLLKCQ